MDVNRVAEEIRANMITLTLINPEFKISPPNRRLKNMCDYARRLKNSKLKIVATDGIIRRVRTGEIDLKHLKEEAAANRQRNRQSQREFVKKLEHLAKLSEPKAAQPAQPQNQNNASEGEPAGEAAGETAGRADGKVEGEAGVKVKSEAMAAGEGSSYMELTEDQKAILLLNKKKETATSRKEASMLMEIIFGKRITREHIELLQRENQKNKASPYGH